MDKLLAMHFWCGDLVDALSVQDCDQQPLLAEMLWLGDDGIAGAVVVSAFSVVSWLAPGMEVMHPP